MSNFYYSYLASGPARSFAITGGLLEGYDRDHGYIHPIEDVIAAHATWQVKMGVIQELAIRPTTICYGSFDHNNEVIPASEPGFVASGGINVLYNNRVTDEEAFIRISDLAAWIADQLKQTRIYLTWAGRDYILERQSTHEPFATPLQANEID